MNNYATQTTLFATLAASAVVVLLSASAAVATPLAIYDPVGSQSPDVADLTPAYVDAGVTASVLRNAGPDPQGNNNNVRPTRAGPGAIDLSGGYYFNFTLTPVSPGEAIQLTSIDYSYQSYVGSSAFTISLLTSADGFGSVVDSFGITGATRGLFTLDASSVAALAGPLEMRFYLHDLLGGANYGGQFNNVDWADIVSTGRGGTGLIINGYVVSVSEPGMIALLGFGLAGLGFARRSKKA